MHALESLGWTSFYADQLAPDNDLIAARVCGGVAPAVHVHDGAGERPALVHGRLRRSGVTIGDWVLLDPATSPATVAEVLRRRSTLARQAAGRATAAQPLAANVDLVLVVEAIDRPFAARRIERLVALAWSCGIEPVVLLTKADLHPDPTSAVRRAAALAPGVAVHALVSWQESAATAVKAMLAPGRTAVLVGPSGAGKSTLTNRLTGRDERRTGEVRGGDRRGRHTTTDRRLLPVPGGGALIDGPGIRELALWAGEEGVERVFADIAELSRGCRFRDCQHSGEPGCAVTAAVGDGRLAAERVASWEKLRRELEVSRLRREGSLAAEERRRWRPIHRAMRRLKEP